MKTLVIKESQYKQLSEMLQAHQSFLNEMEDLGGQLMEGTMMEEGLVDNLSGKFRDLLQKSGVNGLRHAVTAAVVAGSLAGVSSDAIAQAAVKAGVSEPQAKEISIAATSKGSGQQVQTKDFTKELNMLTKRFVVADNDPQQTKHFMNFTGNKADVVGIEPKYGYPIFAKGSESQKELDAAFANPQVTKGIVNVRGQDLPGQFVQSQGLWYTIGDVKPPVATNTPPPAEQGNVAREADPSKLVDYSGTIKQAYLAWQQATKAGQTSEDAPAYIANFFRERIKGFESMSNSQIAGLFKNGTKIAVNKIGNNAASDIGNMTR
jgi:hypothetical protein